MSVSTSVRFYKYPESPHWRFDTVRLGDDEHGVWLGAKANTPARRGSEPWTTFPSAFVMLVPRERWWTMVVNQAPRDPELYIDVCTSARWSGPGLVEMVDLDLDVIRLRDGAVRLLDEDEFVDHSVSLGYPRTMIGNARVTAAELILAAESRVEPFGTAAHRWLAELEDLP